MLSATVFLKKFGFSKLPIRLRHFLYLHTVVLSKALRSEHFREQRQLLSLYFPNVKFLPHISYERDWGSGASLALTRRFVVPRSVVNADIHPEIEAIKGGRDQADRFFWALVEEKGWSQEAASDRRAKTERLLEQDVKELFCEVTIHPPGVLMIHDGFHRAAIMRASDLPGITVKVTMNLFLT